MAKGEKWKALWESLSSSNRFWGAVGIVGGSAIALIPGLQVIGGGIVVAGTSQFFVGATNQRKRKLEEKRKEEAEDGVVDKDQIDQ